MDPYIGKMLDNRYEILERIGTGGMAVVYKAKCHRLNRLVAIKILKADLAQDEDFRRRFNAESQAVAQLSHPNIVSVYDVSRGGDVEYIVMELIDGITLKQYMEKRGLLNWRETLHFITQIMRGLAHAHSRGIIHRDIKPQNVMVLRDGSVKVADFGIACLENSSQTMTQETFGSVHYISPEQARGDRTDARSDIYSAGVVLYEMLTGRLPFEGDTAVSVALQHLSSIPLSPREINPDIPEQMELICLKAMAPDLDRRYPSADAMIADLEAFRKNPDVGLDFQLEDLRPDMGSEPTRKLRPSDYMASVPPVSTTYRPPTQPQKPAPSYEQQPRQPRREPAYYEEPSGRSGSRRQKVLIGVVIVLAIVLVAVLFHTILGSFGSTNVGSSTMEEYSVPSLTGKTVEEARAAVLQDGVFSVEVQGTEESELPAGQITRQSPDASKSVRKVTDDEITIEVWLSAGMEEDLMPDITEENTVASARVVLRKLLEKYDIDIEVSEEQVSETVSEGYIISSSPAAGEPLKKGENIQVVVSKGREKVTVPPFTDMPIDSVLNQLPSMGLQQGEIEEVESDRPQGYVIWQSISANSEVPRDSTINFQVSKGPEEKTEDTPASGGDTSSSSGSTGSSSDNSHPSSSSTGSAQLIVALPEDKRSGHIEVYLDGSLEYEGDLDYESLNWTFMKEFEGSGTAEAQVYLDSQIYKTYLLDFSE